VALLLLQIKPTVSASVDENKGYRHLPPLLRFLSYLQPRGETLPTSSLKQKSKKEALEPAWCPLRPTSQVFANDPNPPSMQPVADTAAAAGAEPGGWGGAGS